MKENFTKRLQGILEEMKWPSKELHFPSDIQARWADSVGMLLDLQMPYVPRRCFLACLTYDIRELQIRETADDHIVEPAILFPLEAMVHPLELRFRYHFSGDKPTNRLDKVS